MLCCLASFAQIPPHYWNVTITPTVANWPFNAQNQKAQILYLPGQFASPTPAQSGVITSLWVRAATSAANILIEDLEIKMGQTTATTFSPNNTYVTTPPMQVVRAMADFSSPGISAFSWLEIPLDPLSGFTYDNTKSLIVEISQTAVTNGFKTSVGNVSGARAIWGTNGSSSGTSEAFQVPGAGVTITYPCIDAHNFSVTNVTTNSADFNWQYQFPNLKHFEFVIDKSATAPTGSNYQPYQTPPLHIDTFQPNTCYYVHIRTNCDSPSYGDTVAATWVTDSFCTVPTCDAPPTNIDVAKITSTSALAVWNAVPGVIKYEYAVSIDTFAPQKGHFTTYTQVLLKGLTPNWPYYFYVRAYCSPIPVSEWNRVPFHTAITTGVDDLASGDFAIEAFPNPAGNTVTILTAGRSNNAQIAIVDMTGKLVKTASVNDDRTVVNLDGLTPGLYFVRYNDENRSEVIKLTKE
jgi:hypothetical protein